MSATSLPHDLELFLTEYWIEHKHLAYFCFGKDECLMNFGGDIAYYFEKPITHGQNASELTPFLAGMIPFEENFVLPCVEFKDKTYANIHLIKSSEDDSYLVVFLDTTAEVANEEKVQQARNDLVLLSEKHKKLMRQHVGDPVVQRIMDGKTALNIDGERRQICTLFADVRAFTVFNEKHDSQEVIYTLNQYLKIMIESVLEQGGIIDKIVGDGLMAIFGVLIQDDNIQSHAYTAARRIQEQVRELVHARKQQDLYPLNVGIGIASGPAVLGILGDSQRQTFSAIGHHVNLAQRLESQARACELLIDSNTWEKLGPQQNDFNRVELQLKGMPVPEIAYSRFWQEELDE